MPVMDEFREEREALKNADLKTKWMYFLDYYKWHTIGIIAGIIAVISFIYSAVTAKDTAFNAYFVNTYADTVKSEAFVNDFAAFAQIDLNEYYATIDTSMQMSIDSLDEMTISSSERIMVTIAAGEVDFLAADEKTFSTYGTPDTMYDLREFFTEEELEKYKDYIYYVDMEEVRRKQKILDEGFVDSYVPKEYDHLAPEEMTDPVPIGLCIQDCPKLKDTYYFKGDITPMGIVGNTKHPETVRLFLDYLFAELIQE